MNDAHGPPDVSCSCGLVEAGGLRPAIDRTHRLDEVADTEHTIDSVAVLIGEGV